MRSVLFTIPLDHIQLGAWGKIPVLGFGLVLAVWVLLGLAQLIPHVRRNGWKGLWNGTTVVWLIVAGAICAAPLFRIRSIPVYGYGTMLFLGFLAAAALAAWRLRRQGNDGEIAWDAAMWIFVSGIIGGRLYYVATHSDRFFGVDPETRLPRTLAQTLLALVNLPDGGLVLYGSLIVAPLAYVLFCRRRDLSALALGDLAITSVFVGLMFGRLGCFLHGCCYGRVCELPWSVQFPQGSVPFSALVDKGLLAKDQLLSLPLHPSQLYDSLNALLIALTTYAYYPFRRRSGEVILVGWLLYPINRFLIEFLRFDEPTIGFTRLTGAQLVSLALFGTGVAFCFWLRRRPASRTALQTAEPPPLPNVRVEPRACA